MAYEKTLANAEKHMTKKYDAAFAEVEYLRWYPWVGKNYDKTRILILGMSTYYEEGESWSEKWKELCSSVNPSRVLAIQRLISSESKQFKERKPFKAMSKMFVCDAAGKPYNKNTVKMFWESVAFSNHCQEVVKGVSGGCPDKKKANSALRETLNILKPSLCLVWSTQMWKLGFSPSEYRKCRSVSRSRPRVVDQPSPLVGIRHPSRGFSRRKWLNFLLSDDTTKGPTADFIAYLQSQPVE